jgi:hypothetical protein
VCNDTPEAAAPLTGYRAELGPGDDVLDFARAWAAYGLNGSIAGGPGADTITGGPRSETIDGGLGADTLSGGDGDDTILARDGAVDTIDCGAGNDHATVDAGDLVTGCEAVDAPSAAPPVSSAPPPAATPPPAVGPPAIVAGVVSSAWLSFRRYTLLTRLRIQELVRGTQVTLRCSGHSCPIKRRTVTVKGLSLNLLRPFKHVRLRPGTTITVTLTRPGMTTKTVSLRIRRRMAPSRRVSCRPPGSKRAQRC